MKKLYDFFELILVIIGMLCGLAICFKGLGILFISSLIFWAFVVAVICIYKRSNIAGILTAFIGAGACIAVPCIMFPDALWIEAVLYICCILLGGLVLWASGSLTFAIIEGGKCLYQKLKTVTLKNVAGTT